MLTLRNNSEEYGTVGGEGDEINLAASNQFQI
jgi:hypothetical protein